jgi:hypothetical protein
MHRRCLNRCDGSKQKREGGGRELHGKIKEWNRKRACGCWKKKTKGPVLRVKETNEPYKRKEKKFPTDSLYHTRETRGVFGIQLLKWPLIHSRPVHSTASLTLAPVFDGFVHRGDQMRNRVASWRAALWISLCHHGPHALAVGYLQCAPFFFFGGSLAVPVVPHKQSLRERRPRGLILHIVNLIPGTVSMTTNRRHYPT